MYSFHKHDSISSTKIRVCLHCVKGVTRHAQKKATQKTPPKPTEAGLCAKPLAQISALSVGG